MGHRFLEREGLRAMVGAEEEEPPDEAPGSDVHASEDAAQVRIQRLDLVTVNVDGISGGYPNSTSSRMEGILYSIMDSSADVEVILFQ